MNSNLTIKCIKSSDNDFYDICNYCEKNINRENLNINGGVLENYDITYQSIMLFVTYFNQTPIAYASIKIKKEGEYYISQIAIKNEYKRIGIGRAMVKMIIKKAEEDNMNLRTHVRYWNKPSLELFHSLGFDQSDTLTKRGSYTFKLKILNLDNNHTKIKR